MVYAAIVPSLIQNLNLFVVRSEFTIPTKSRVLQITTLRADLLISIEILIKFDRCLQVGWANRECHNPKDLTTRWTYSSAWFSSYNSIQKVLGSMSSKHSSSVLRLIGL
jgi:hypothetical protein